MRARAFSLFVGLIAAVALVSVSGAATAKVERAARIDVSTRASVVRYLRSIHVNPRGVVIQRGARNYAGADCPGKGWSCTSTAHPVVQVASAGGRNSFTCSTGRCAVVHVSVSAAANTARCVKAGLLTLTTCAITQSNSKGDNLAIVFENIRPGPSQATSKATITQTASGASNGNTACVTQNVKLKRSGRFKFITASLDAHQTVKISQDATGSGANSAKFGAKSSGVCDLAHPLGQNQTLISAVKGGTGAVTQKENATDHGANVTIDIEQNQGVGHGQASGTNNATFVQTSILTAIANSTNGPVSQIQSSPGGGVLGTVNQDSTGVSTASATQTMTECEAAYGAQCPNANAAPALLTQTKLGPVHSGAGLAKKLTQKQRSYVRKGIGTSTQTGNSNDTFTVDQEPNQRNTAGTGQTNLVRGDCSSAGNCTVSQTVNVNNQQKTNTQSGQNVSTQTGCSGTTCTSGPPPKLVANNNTGSGGGPIQTYDLGTGALVNSFVPDGAQPSDAVGSAVAVAGNEVFYTELSSLGTGPSDGIHVAPFNGGAGGSDLRVLPNPVPTRGIQDLAFANGNLYALTGYSSGPLQVWKLNPANGSVISGPLVIGGPDPSATGFTVLPDGSFLISDDQYSCTYQGYDAITGLPTGLSITVDGLLCTGVDTDGSWLYFSDQLGTFTTTDLSGNALGTTAVGTNDIVDIAVG